MTARRTRLLGAAWVVLVLGLQTEPRAVAFHSTNPYDARAKSARESLLASASAVTAAGPLFELVGLVDRVPDESVVAPLAQYLQPAAGQPKPDPLVAAWAAFQLARLYEDQGRASDAQILRAGLGLVERFSVLGPFEAPSRSALQATLAPELVPLRAASATTFEGKSQTVSWRRMENAARSGVVLLDAAVAPQQEAAALLMVYIYSGKAQRAALRLGSAGPVKAWVNGAPVLTVDVIRAARMDQDAALVSLRKGENTLVIKTLSIEGAWRMVVRLTATSGATLAGVTTSLDGKTAPTLKQTRPPHKGRVRQLGVELEAGWNRAMAARQTDDMRLWGNALARLWAYANPFDKDEKPVERVLAQTLAKADDVALRRLLGEAAKLENDRRAALEVALAGTADPDERCLILSNLADLAQAARRPVQALTFRHQAVAASSSVSCWPAVMALAEESRVAGLPARALKQIDELPAAVAALPIVRKRRARVLQSMGLVVAARTEIQAVSQARPADVDVIEAAMSDARAKGDVETLIRLTDSMARQRPDLLVLLLDHVRALEGNGQTDAALAKLNEGLILVPGAAELHEAKGRLLARVGRPADGALALGQALSLRPQNPSLRKYWEALRKASAGDKTDEAAADLARRYAVDPWTAAKAALDQPIVATPPDAARVLLDRKVVHVHDNGLSEMFAQRLVHVLTEPGARDNETFQIRYTPGAQEVEVRQARVFRKNSLGVVETSSATARDDRDLSEPWYALYYDNRAEVVTFEGLRAGDVVEIQYTVADVSARNELAGYFGDFQFVAENVPTDLWQYTLVGPKAKRFFFHNPSLPTLTQKQVDRGSELEYQFMARTVPKMVPEPSMPGWAEIAPYFHVSTYETWDQVGRWYWDLVAEQLVPDAELKRRALEAVQGQTTLQDKVRAIHKTVIQGTRYVGLEFGIHGYKPYRVSQILSRRFGDCKDKASLLVSMLKVVGVDAQMVLVRTRRGGNVDTLPASLAVFDHAIAYVPALDLYLDGTAEFAGMAELPSQDQGTMVLRVWPGGSQLVHTPVLPSATNRALRSWQAKLSADGSATVDEAVTVIGQAAPEWRQHYQTAGERQEKYGKVWNARFPGAVVSALQVHGAEDPNQPVRVVATISVPALAETQAGGLLLPVSSRPPEYLRSYARLSSRRTDLLLAYPWQHEETLTFALPEGISVARLPAPTALSTSFGQFDFQAQLTPDNRSVVVTTRLDIKQHRFTPAAYPEFRKFLGSVESTLRGRIELLGLAR